MSKTTFFQIFECISLKVLETGSLQIFANPCKFASQLWQQQKNFKPFHFFGKMSLPQSVYFSISIFLYKLTHLNTQTYSRNLHTHTYSRNWHTHTYSRNWHTQTYSRHICTHAYSTNWHTFTYSIIWHNRTYILHKSTYWYILQKLTYSYKRRTYIVQKLAYPYILQKQDSTHEMTYLGYLPAQLLYCTLCTVYMYIKLTFKGGAERHDNHPDEEVGHGQGGDQVVGGRVQAPLLHHSL